MCFPWSCCSLQWYFSYNILCWISAFKLCGSMLLCGALLNWFLILPMNVKKKIEKPKFYFQLHPEKSRDKQVQKYMRAKGCFIYSEFISKLIQDHISGEKFWRRQSRGSHSLQDEGNNRIFSCFLADIMSKTKFLHWPHDAPIPLKLPSDRGWIYFMGSLQGFHCFSSLLSLPDGNICTQAADLRCLICTSRHHNVFEVWNN